MRNNIRDIHDLRLEIVRTEADQKEAEQKLKNSLSALGNQLTPGKLVRAAAGSVLKGSDGKPTILSTAIENVIPAVVSGLIFKNAGPLVKTLSSVVGSSFAKKVFGDDGGKVVERFRNLVSKIRNKTAKPDEPFDESGIYNSEKPNESSASQP